MCTIWNSRFSLGPTFWLTSSGWRERFTHLSQQKHTGQTLMQAKQRMQVE